MSVEIENAQWFANVFERITQNVGRALLGKEDVIRLALTCMFSEGHLLLEDAPGTGKTALARAVAATVAGTNSRIQFTPDLLPSDITGTNIYNTRLDVTGGKQVLAAANGLADDITVGDAVVSRRVIPILQRGKVRRVISILTERT